MRRLSLLGTVVAINFATVGLGKYIDGEDGKLAISNITAVLLLLVAFPWFLSSTKTINKNVVGFLCVFNLFAALSFAIYLYRYGWPPNYAVLFFQEVEILSALLIVWYGRENYAEFRAAVHFGTICSALISLWYGAMAFANGNIFVLVFGMDDKSQAAVLLCCQAFILLRYFGGTLDYLVAGLLMMMSFTTLSRLPVFFIPVILLTIVKRSKTGTVLVALMGGCVTAAFIFVGDAITQLFKVFDRLSSINAISSDSATSAHLMLIETALRMKFTDATTFFFGSGPGNFAKALTSFPISFKELEALDPTLINDARKGRAPMHSTPLSALLDYSIVVFGMLCFLVAKAVRYLILARKHVELFFFASLFGASIFYSLHNKAYFFILSAAVVVLMSQDTGRKAGHWSARSMGLAPQDLRQATTQKTTNTAMEMVENRAVRSHTSLFG